MNLFSKMRFIVMFVTAVCVLFLVKLRWPKKKSLYDTQSLFLLNAELMNVTKLYENINVGQTEYKLKGMVRSYNKHFNLAVLV